MEIFAQSSGVMISLEYAFNGKIQMFLMLK